MLIDERLSYLFQLLPLPHVKNIPDLTCDLLNRVKPLHRRPQEPFLEVSRLRRRRDGIQQTVFVVEARERAPLCVVQAVHKLHKGVVHGFGKRIPVSWLLDAGDLPPEFEKGFVFGVERLLGDGGRTGNS